MERFDVIVIGVGSAGQTAASELAEAGLSVAVVDSREYGGTCALRGCEPKKVLFTAVEVAERAARQAGHGVDGAVSIDWADLLAFKRTFTEPKPAAIEKWFDGLGITLLHGEARFVSPDTVRIGEREFTAGHFVVATGAVPLPLGIPGAELVIDSEALMELESLPRRVVFIGGGYISFEFAHILAAAGVQVTIAHRSPRVLRGFDGDLSDRLAEAYRARGIEIRTDAPVDGVYPGDSGGLDVVFQGGTAIECDVVVHGAGRVPDIERLGLDAAGVDWDRHGIRTDQHMCAPGNPRIYAAGDAAAQGAPLTPVAIAQARVVAQNILKPESAAFAPRVTASVCFSDPPLASVGMGEEEAREAGEDVEVKLTDSTDWASSRRVGASVAGAKTIVERSTGRILGAHLLGHHAEEVINVFALAISRRVTVDELKATLWAYPTASSEIVYLI